MHGLAAQGGHVDDRQPAEAERQARLRIDPGGGIVRAAMGNGVGHALGDAGEPRGRQAPLQINKAGQAAHGGSFPYDGARALQRATPPRSTDRYKASPDLPSARRSS